MIMDILSRAEEILLLAILRLGDNAYGLSIAKEIGRRTGKAMKLGALWVSLDIAHQKGLVSKRIGDPTPQRGGRSKIFYRLTPEGYAALESARALSRSLWQGLPKSLKGLS
jgi:PadR family transcriptional regulator, regulatory protein PadR